MKKNIILLMLVTISTTSACSVQGQECNRKVYIESYQERMPKDICLPEGYMLRSILSDTTDMNSDGKIDFAAKLYKVNKQDGDTTLVVLYKQNEAGDYDEWVTFNNLFPIYLKDYSYDYYRDRNDTSFFMNLRRWYQYPEFSNVFFNKDTITVKFNTGGGGGLLLYFSFNKNKENWYLVKQAEWYGSLGRIEKIPDYEITIPQNQYSIKEFNMLDYLEE
jgi:hypothetical protein